jgi:tetratricopeptide (TPR) repeat protein
MSSGEGPFGGLTIQWLDPEPDSESGFAPEAEAWAAGVTALVHFVTLAEQASESLNVDAEDWEAVLVDAAVWADVEPGAPTAYSIRGLALERLERYQEALDAFDFALVLEPGSGEHLWQRGRMLVELGRHDEALASYDEAIAENCDPDSAWKMHLERGKVLHLLDRDAESLAACSQALAGAGSEPDQLAEVLLYRTDAQEGCRDIDAAMADFTRILELKPGWGTGLYNRGAMFARLGRFPEALADLAAAFDAEPGYLPVAIGSADLRDLETDAEFGPRYRTLVGMT